MRTLASSSFADVSSTADESATAGAFQIEHLSSSHRARADVEEFISRSFRDVYGAEIQQFCDTLAVCRDLNGRTVAALGYSYAKDGPLFLEHYLDLPADREIALRTGSPVHRDQLVEVGNLAASHVGAARRLIRSMTSYLYDQELVWVAFTATRHLLNSFSRLRLRPDVLANADPLRLPDGGRSWGRYYDTKPQVMFGNIQKAYAQLSD